MDLKKEFRKHKKIYHIYYEMIGKKREERTISKRKDDLKKHGLAVINSINNALDNIGINYFVDFGTLIGAVREHQFLSWDSDIDYGFVREEDFSWDILEQALNEISMKKIRELSYQGRITEQTYQVGNLTVDFFEHTNKGDISQCLFYTHYDNEDQYTAIELTTPIIAKTILSDLDNIKVRVPENYDQYLESVYTKNWKKPDPNWNGNTANLPNRKIMPGYGYAYFFK